MRDPTSQLRSATRRAKSDVANKLISMCLHELSRRISEGWPIKVDGEEYEKLAREQFGNRCPYCSCDLSITGAVIEHLDGMNRYRADSTSQGMSWSHAKDAMGRSDGTTRQETCRADSRAGRRSSRMMECDALPRVRRVGTGRVCGQTKGKGRSDYEKTWRECVPSEVLFRNLNASFPAS